VRGNVTEGNEKLEFGEAESKRSESEERTEADKKACVKIFEAAKTTTTGKDINRKKLQVAIAVNVPKSKRPMDAELLDDEEDHPSSKT
jgi:hypothetical protein